MLTEQVAKVTEHRASTEASLKQYKHHLENERGKVAASESWKEKFDHHVAHVHLPTVKSEEDLRRLAIGLYHMIFKTSSNRCESSSLNPSVTTPGPTRPYSGNSRWP